MRKFSHSTLVLVFVLGCAAGGTADWLVQHSQSIAALTAVGMLGWFAWVTTTGTPTNPHTKPDSAAPSATGPARSLATGNPGAVPFKHCVGSDAAPEHRRAA